MRQIRQTLRLHLRGRAELRPGRPRAEDRQGHGRQVRAAGPRRRRRLGAGPDAERRGTRGAAVPPGGAALEPPARARLRAGSTRNSSAPASRCSCCGRSTPRGNALAYKYTSFCVKYRAWAQRLKRSMRQTHIAGEKLFVDYAGQTVPIIDAATGEIRRRRSSWPCSARRTTPTPAPPRRRPPPTGSARIIAALEFIGGVPRLIVPDQPRALIARPDRYEPEPQPPGRGVLPTTTAWRCCRRARRIRATSPRSRSRCRWSSAGSWRGCATGASSAWPSSTRRSPSCWSS